jgi:CDP-paratose 2-epimerase
MSAVLVTGSGGLVGSEAALHFGGLGFHVVGVDNDLRRVFFGEEASTSWNRTRLASALGASYEHHDLDIRDADGISQLVARLGSSLELVVHTAAQPSHDWAASDPHTDFDVNARGTLNVLEAVRQHAPDAVVIFTSTNKVYGDAPNALPLVELETRYELAPDHLWQAGIPEELSVDACLHSLFGVSKLAADAMVQEYGRYFGLRTACFRGGTLTGPQHSATRLHGFLAYVMRCAMTGEHYTVCGYKGKQVRDALHSNDLVRAFEAFYREPKPAAVYNIGGGRTSNASVLEAISLAEVITGREMSWSYDDVNRIGDHVWWIGDNGRFERDFPHWKVTHDVKSILGEIHEANAERWA